MFIALQNSNTKNKPQQTFGLDYTRATRRNLKRSVASLTSGRGDFEIAKKAIQNLGELRRRNDGLVAHVPAQASWENFPLWDQMAVRSKNTKGKQPSLVSVGTHERAMDHFFQQHPDKVEVDSVERRANYGKAVGWWTSKDMLVTTDYLKTQEFVDAAHKDIQGNGTGQTEKEYKKALAKAKSSDEDSFLTTVFSTPTRIGEPSKNPIRDRVSEVISNLFDTVGDSVETTFEHLENFTQRNLPVLYKSKEERQQMKELRKLIDQNLG